MQSLTLYSENERLDLLTVLLASIKVTARLVSTKDHSEWVKYYIF